MKIAVPLQTVFAMPVLFWGLAGGQDQAPFPPPRADFVNTHSIKKNARIFVPSFVAGKWKAVRIAVIDKSSNTQKVYSIPIEGNLTIPASAVTIKVESFLPAFIMEGGIMTSSSNDLKNPGVLVHITDNGAYIFKGWLFSKFPNSHAFMHPKYGFALVGVVPASK